MTEIYTHRFDLPLLMPGQAQKEITHNEALVRIDALLHPLVEAISSTPPVPDGENDNGRCWIIAPLATGIWNGKDGQMACWHGSGWRYIEPSMGMRARNRAMDSDMVWTGDAWIAAPALANPGGGTVIDEEARICLISLLDHLRATGVLAI